MVVIELYRRLEELLYSELEKLSSRTWDWSLENQARALATRNDSGSPLLLDVISYAQQRGGLTFRYVGPASDEDDGFGERLHRGSAFGTEKSSVRNRLAVLLRDSAQKWLSVLQSPARS